jgi:microfibrillar-associated protein 1
MSGFEDKALMGMFQVGENKSEKTASFEPKFDPSKKQGRLRAGVAPSWSKNTNEVGDEDEDEEYEETQHIRRPKQKAALTSVSQSGNQPVDRRLALVARQANTYGDDGETAAPRRRRIYDAEIVEEDTNKQSTKNERLSTNHDRDSEEERLRIRRAQAQRSRNQNKDIEEVMKKEESEFVSESEYETDTDSSDEEEDAVDLPKPVFISRKQRQEIQEAKETEAEAIRHKEISRKKAQQQVSRSMVAESIKRNDTIVETDGNDSDVGLPDDTDGIDQESEYEEWQIRELKRLQRDIEARKIDIQEENNVQARRAMTDEEVTRLKALEAATESFHDNDNGSKTSVSTSSKRYHKGAFFMDNLEENDVRNRDFSGMTSTELAFHNATMKNGRVKNSNLKKGTINYEANSTNE